MISTAMSKVADDTQKHLHEVADVLAIRQYLREVLSAEDTHADTPDGLRYPD